MTVVASQNSGSGFGGNIHQLHNYGHLAQTVATRAESISHVDQIQGIIPETTVAATLHTGKEPVSEQSFGPNQYGANQYTLSNDTAADLTLSFKDGVSQGGVSQKDKCLPKMEAAVEDDVFGFE